MKLCRGYEEELRWRGCSICFRLRLNETAKTAKENNCDCFTTTLTMGSSKRAEIINKIGKEEAEKFGIKFREDDFKKKTDSKRQWKSAKI